MKKDESRREKENVNRAERLRSDLELMYGDLYTEWNGKYHDDRQIYCNIYNQMMEALEALNGMANVYVWVAVRHEMNRDEKVMREIEQKFE